MPANVDDKKHMIFTAIPVGSTLYIRVEPGDYAVGGRAQLYTQGANSPMQPISHAELVLQGFRRQIGPQMACEVSIDIAYIQPKDTRARIQVALLGPNMKPIAPPIVRSYYGRADDPASRDNIQVYARSF